jgi:hypothetical protein
LSANLLELSRADPSWFLHEISKCLLTSRQKLPGAGFSPTFEPFRNQQFTGGGFGKSAAAIKAVDALRRLTMRNPVIRTAMITSLVTAIAVSALSLYAVPRLMSSNNDSPYTAQPAVNNAPVAQDDTYITPPPHARLRRAYYQGPANSQPAYSQPAYSQPVYSQPAVQHRSLGKSVLIVAGSSAAGAGIGALAGGKKGAGIGAIAGGLGGFIYDRTTANHVNH